MPVHVSVKDQTPFKHMDEGPAEILRLEWRADVYTQTSKRALSNFFTAMIRFLHQQ